MMDSKTTHTPGPWGLTEDGNWLQLDGGNSAMKDGHYLSICVSATTTADKRLIAAAPDLLEALKAAKEVVDVAEGMTSCRSDDDFIWSAQKLINAAIHVPGIGLEWTNNEDEALRYTDIDEAQEDAEAQGGEVVTFEAPAWRGHNAAARLERRFLMAAE